MTSWALFNIIEADKDNKFSIFRCPNPTATKTSEPWYPTTNFCPCDPKLSNVSGRGFTSCPFGIVEEPVQFNSVVYSHNSFPKNNKIIGNLYSQKQTTPPQLDPRPFSRIGQTWRASN